MNNDNNEYFHDVSLEKQLEDIRKNSEKERNEIIEHLSYSKKLLLGIKTDIPSLKKQFPVEGIFFEISLGMLEMIINWFNRIVNEIYTNREFCVLTLQISFLIKNSIPKDGRKTANERLEKLENQIKEVAETTKIKEEHLQILDEIGRMLEDNKRKVNELKEKNVYG